MNATPATNGDLVAEIRHAVQTAQAEGRPTPGRPTLMRLTGATDHAVKKALATLATQDHHGRQPPAPPSPHPASPGEPGDPRPPAERHTTSTRANTTGTSAAAGGRLVAWAGFVFGSVMSIAANVLHTWLPAAHQPPDWTPGLAPQIGAAVWPIGLLLSVEVLSRVRWPRGWAWGLARFGGSGTVALGSAVISYGHLRDVLLAWRYGTLAAAVGPLVLDGLMVISGFALLAISLATSATSHKPGDASPADGDNTTQ